jgi:hypothetical protein
MGTYVMLTKVSPESMASPAKIKNLEEEVKARVKRHCPEVKWIANYAVLARTITDGSGAHELTASRATIVGRSARPPNVDRHSVSEISGMVEPELPLRTPVRGTATCGVIASESSSRTTRSTLRGSSLPAHLGVPERSTPRDSDTLLDFAFRTTSLTQRRPGRRG